MRRRHESLGLGFLVAAGLQFPAAQAQQICGDWTTVAPPAGATSAATYVTALSPTDAWAVVGTLGTIHWDGTSWAPVALPDLSNLGSAYSLDAMGSVGSTVFLAGVLQTGVWTNEQLLLTWDGSQWDRVESMELAQNAFGQPRYGAPRAVDAAGPDDIWIVGTASSQGVGVVLTVHWDGSQLVEYVTPGLGSRQNHLYDVSVVASDDVWAVGEFTNWSTPGDNGTLHGMTYHWDGTAWNPVPNPTETIDSVDLHAVEAIASDDVWAAGSDPNGPLFMHWDGASWTIVPSPATTGTIHELAAIASDDIWAVDSPSQVPLLSKYYHWDGIAWSVVTPPDIPGATQVSRRGLAAAGECDMWAVGSSYDGQVVGPLIERLQAGSTVTSTPLVAAAGGSGLRVAPNPIRHSATIVLQNPGDTFHRARIYDVRGQLVRSLNDLSWDGRDEGGLPVNGGVYFLRVDSDEGRVLTQKVTVVR